jgi:hypothetical protein
VLAKRVTQSLLSDELMIITNHQDYTRIDTFGDKDTLVHNDFQGLSHDKSAVSFDTVNEDHFPDAHKSLEESPLAHNAADVGRSENYSDLGRA